MGKLPLGLALLLAPATTPAASTARCPLIGATYVTRTAAPTSPLTYRLKVEALPRSAPAAAVATLWHFQTLARDSGRQLSELRMHHSCPNGDGACSISLPSRPGPQGGPSSEVIGLNRDFSPASGEGAPYAIVLPGFAHANWLFTLEQLASPDLTLAAGAQDGPDLSGETVWVLNACGGAARSR